MERQESETSSPSSSTNRDTDSSADKKKDHVAAPLTAWEKSVEIEPPSLHNGHAKLGDSLRPDPKSEAESASVNDLGEAKRLYNHDEEFITQGSISQDQLDRITTGAGTQFPDSSSEYENGASPRYPGSLQEFANDAPQLLSLGSKLRAELRSSLAGKDGRKFLPRDKFDEILTIKAVRQELKTHAAFQNAEDGKVKRLTDKIYKASMTEPGNPSSATHRRKLFALLALMQMVPAIEEFISAGIHDSDLPFVMEENKASIVPFYCMYRWHDIRKPGPSENRIPISCFSKWQDHQIEGFHTNQWQLLAPYFELGSGNIKLYNLHDNIILPFIEDTSDNWKEGGFSDVWRVKIHRAHWHFSNQQKSDADNPSYAIKRLRQDNREAFDKEVEALKRFSDQNDLHLINLLLTFNYRGKYHLFFPWADGNLSSFWGEHRSHESPRRDWIFVQWFARQWLGIAKGLQAIHKPPPRAETQDPNNPRDNGRHGDLKPENILWFKSGHRDLTDPDGFGVFVISDFGLTSFHRNETKDLVSPSHLARSPTYRPPECDVCKTISPSYDMWSFGCILLEFVIWFMHGWDGVVMALERRLETERHTASEENYREDKFFELIEKGILEDDNRIGKVARLKTCVKEEFSFLRKQGTSPFFHELLEYVYDNLLRMRPDKRATCENIVTKFNDMYQRCLKDEDYCTKVVKKNDRTLTNISELNAFHQPIYKSVGLPKDPVFGSLGFDGPGPQTSYKDSTDALRRPNSERVMTESPTPWERGTEIHKIPSKSSLKQRHSDSLHGAVDMAPPSPKTPPRTDSNSTGESSPRKSVSWAKEPDFHRSQHSLPESSQPSDVASQNPRDGEGVSQPQPKQKSDQHSVDKTAPVSTPENPDQGLDDPNATVPSSSVILEEGQGGGKENAETNTTTESEAMKAQEITPPTGPLIPPTSQTLAVPQSTPLAPPPQPTPRSSNGEQPKVGNDLAEDFSTWRLFIMLCKRLWCC